MENTLTPNPTQTTAVAAAIGELANAIMLDRAKAENRTLDERAVPSFLGHASEKIGRAIATLDLGEFPFNRRERVTLDDLFGAYTPYRLTVNDIRGALDALREAAAQEPLDEDEQTLQRDFEILLATAEERHLEVYTADDDALNDYLNEQIPMDLPDWINDNIDWDALYSKVTRGWKFVETSFGGYVLVEV